MPVALYQRMVRVVSYLFIAAVAAIVTLTNDPAAAAVYVLLVVGIVLLVLFQDLLPATSLARWRMPLEAAATTVWLTILVMLTGGLTSPYFFGYILLLAAGSLWASGWGAPILALVTTIAYLLAVVVASGPELLTAEGAGLVAFNVISLGLVTYVAWVIGREQRRAREEALRISRFDALTGLTSRAHFTSTTEREIQRASRTGRAFALLMTDLDGLKAANDRFGHDSGDRLLQAVAEILRGDIRVTDVAARYAGDEFVLLLPETDLAGALRVAEKVRVDISRLALPHNGSLIRTSASIGVVTYPDDGRTFAELMRRADLAMYEAKRRGRDQIVHYMREPQMATRPVASAPPARQHQTGPGVPPPSPGLAPWERRAS
jgi:diguanylate cyclase (GGDEF)-like protein